LVQKCLNLQINFDHKYQQIYPIDLSGQMVEYDYSGSRWSGCLKSKAQDSTQLNLHSLVSLSLAHIASISYSDFLQPELMENSLCLPD